MSVVAVKVTKKDITVGADSIMIAYATQFKDKLAKLNTVNGMVIGYVGWSEEGNLFWKYCKTRRPSEATEEDVLDFISEFHDWLRKKTGTPTIKLKNEFIMVFDGKAFDIDNYDIKEVDDYHAIGAGMDYALSALYLGKSVHDAIDVSCELSIYCEKPINIITVKK